MLTMSTSSTQLINQPPKTSTSKHPRKQAVEFPASVIPEVREAPSWIMDLEDLSCFYM